MPRAACNERLNDMFVRRLAPKEQQPANFTFTAENLAWAKEQIAKYPEGRRRPPR